jgi:virulence-associated protein VagC
MAQIATAFWLAGSQAVRLPREFWFEGDELRIERLGALIVLSPVSGPSVARDWPSPMRPDTTVAGFVGGRPTRHRSTPASDAEIRRLFTQAAANDNAPVDPTEKPAA